MTVSAPMLTENASTPVPLVYDINEAAHVLRCGRTTVYALLASGELTGLKIGSRRLVTHESAVAFVERQVAG